MTRMLPARGIPTLLFCLVIGSVQAQSLYLPQGNKHLPFLERLEIILQKNPELNIASARTVSRHVAVDVSGLQDSSSGHPSVKLSKVDQFNLRSLLRNSAEWVNFQTNRKGIFYRNSANFLELSNDKLFVAINPMIQAQHAVQQEDGQRISYFAGGANLRGMIAERLGFYASATRNLENPPAFVRNRITENNAVPGAGVFTKYNSGAYDYWDLRGGITFRALKYFDFQLAYDRNFIGNGYRSLFLSDYAKSYLFVKGTARVWKFKYQLFYSPFITRFDGTRTSNQPLLGKRMTAMHHLSIDATKWLNVALFQSVSIVDRKDFLYMMPVIFYPVNTLLNHKPANNLGGFELKANLAKTAQFYGQFLVDNFNISSAGKKDGWWNNRFGVQLGAKYINVFNIQNLDLQVEFNAVRPYTYSADSLGSYTHYNQPLAHPLGSNFREGIAILRYQPANKLITSLRMIFWKQGLDTAGVNMGNNPLKRPDSRPADYGFGLPAGLLGTGLNTQFLLSYELAENIFLDAALFYRKFTVEKNIIAENKVFLFTAGIRMNMFRREYDY